MPSEVNNPKKLCTSAQFGVVVNSSQNKHVEEKPSIIASIRFGCGGVSKGVGEWLGRGGRELVIESNCYVLYHHVTLEHISRLLVCTNYPDIIGMHPAARGVTHKVCFLRRRWSQASEHIFQ